MTDHTIKSYDAELQHLDAALSEMGGLAEHMLRMAFDSIERRNAPLAEKTIETDRRVDALRRQIDDTTIDMIARRQPVAEDLRRVLASLRIAGELERIGDLSKNIARRALAIGNEPMPQQLATGLRRMVDQVSLQLKHVLDAYGERNTDKALKVWQSDAKVDAIYNSVFRELLTYMMEDPRSIGPATHLMFVAKNIERIGDHATNIAEMVHHLVTGDSFEDARPKGDMTSSTMVQPLT